MQRPNGVPQGFDMAQGSQQGDPGNRANSPPERKRMRRNSGSAAPSPFPGAPTPQQQMQYTPQGTPIQQPMQMNMQQNDQQARVAYEKQMHKDQAMRSMHLSQNGVMPPAGFAPHTPNMSSLDASSPATLNQGIGVGQSPRTTTAARAMARDQSKSNGGGAMLPPQSPAMPLQRANTPKPNPTKTPKQKEEVLPIATPKSLQPSPHIAVISVPDQSASAPGSSHGLTPSPPINTSTNTKETSMSNPPKSVSSLSTDPNSLSFGTNTDLMADPGDFLNADLDFSSLVSMGDGFDFGLYLAELGDDTGDNNGEIGIVP